MSDATQRLEIPMALQGERVDRALAIITGLSRRDVTAWIKSGDVRLGGDVVQQAHRHVIAGEVLEVPNPIAFEARALVAASQDVVSFAVVYEDEAIVVIDKPAGLVVHPGAGHIDDTLVSGLIHRFPDLVTAGAGDPMRPGIVHRLDKDTSGLLVVARTPDAHAHLVGQLSRHEMGRTYAALVLGRVASDQGVIDAPVGRSTRRRLQMAVQASGREARTHYNVLQRFEAPIAATLIDATLETGRTHQIRVHFSTIGHPVAGDVRYRGTARALGLTRPFLHAKQLVLVHPVTMRGLTFTSALPEDLLDALARLT